LAKKIQVEAFSEYPFVRPLRINGVVTPAPVAVDFSVLKIPYTHFTRRVWSVISCSGLALFCGSLLVAPWILNIKNPREHLKQYELDLSERRKRRQQQQQQALDQQNLRDH